MITFIRAFRRHHPPDRDRVSRPLAFCPPAPICSARERGEPGTSTITGESMYFHRPSMRRLALVLALSASAMTQQGIAATDEEAPQMDRTMPSSFATYPGVYPIYVMEVRDAKTLYVNAAVWPGFQRTFLITIPKIATPSDNIKAPACEQALAAKAKAFTTAFFKDAERPEIRDVQMQNTALEDGSANAYTEKGSLADALLEKGFARPDSVDPATPWCEDP